MKEKIAYGCWACLYVLCVWLGVVNQPEGAGKILFVLAALAFFVPGVLLLVWGIREDNRKQIKTVRILAVLSLSLTLMALIANFCSVLFSETLGNVLHTVLVVVSAPMVCSQYWVLSLFLWASLLMGSFLKIKK